MCVYAEWMCRHFREDFGLATRVARYHNVYGPHGDIVNPVNLGSGELVTIIRTYDRMAERSARLTT